MDIESFIGEADRAFPALYQLLAGYFHQDWRDEFASPEAAVRSFAAEAPPAAVDAAVAELDRLLGWELDEAALTRLLWDGFGCDYVPQSDETAPSRWLATVRAALAAAPRA
jgi:phenylalanyl-tRNA synthetase beta subunit